MLAGGVPVGNADGEDASSPAPPEVGDFVSVGSADGGGNDGTMLGRAVGSAVGNGVPVGNADGEELSSPAPEVGDFVSVGIVDGSSAGSGDGNELAAP